MILVTGAGGKTGRAIVEALIAKGRKVRLFVRHADQAAQLRQIGAQEIVIGDMRDRSAADEAVRGVESIYHICPNVHPDEIAIGENMLRAAHGAGVDRFVYHSVLHPQTEAMPHHWKKMRIEETIFESGLAFTVMQPAPYMQNVLAQSEAMVNRGIYAVPYRAAARLSMVDLSDVAEAASIVLTQEGHIGATYELSGPEALSQFEVATILSQELQREIRLEITPIESWAERARASGLGVYQIETLTKMFQYYDRHGLIGSPNILTWLLGRPPTRFADFVERTLRDHAAK